MASPRPNQIASQFEGVNFEAAIITRTLNRPLLLTRAAESIGAQTFQDFVWVVVNDGGEEAPVRKIMEESGIDPRRRHLICSGRARGMEAASNTGIRSVRSQFIAIHDDDDSWDADFLKETIAYLKSPNGARYGGVITKCWYVSEEIREGNVIEHGRWPYNSWVHNVQISEMAAGNFFPPISFVFRRNIYDEVGGYDEDLPVLGDWNFNLEFLIHSDIGVLAKPLAFYHHRDRGNRKDQFYANSVIGGEPRHREYDAIVRNAFLRRHVHQPGIAMVVATGYLLENVRRTLKRECDLETVTLSDISDMKWVCMQINQEMAKMNVRGFLSRLFLKSVSPEDGWDKIMNRIKILKIDIPSPPDFNEAAYLSRYPDIAEAVDKGQLYSAYFHYLKYGRTEGRVRPNGSGW